MTRDLVLWAPVLSFNRNPAVEVLYRTPRDTRDPRYAACTNHRPACDCREAHMQEDRNEAAFTREENIRFEEVIDAVLLLHHRNRARWPGTPDRCAHCTKVYPCPTRTMLAPLSWREQMKGMFR